MLDEVKKRKPPKQENQIYLQYGQARAHDRAARRQLNKAIERKKVTEAKLKALGMPLED
jgi:hypothetical protein